MFTADLVDHIVYQTNLYAEQNGVVTTHKTDKHEIIAFLGIVIYMGVCRLPSTEDYWASETRVPQVADVMSYKRFELLRSILRFNNNENSCSSTDKFYKVRPVFTFITKQFLQVPATSAQSLDEVSIACQGNGAGNRPDLFHPGSHNLGFKLYCRASEDGFVHDVLLYQ